MQARLMIFIFLVIIEIGLSLPSQGKLETRDTDMGGMEHIVRDRGSQPKLRAKRNSLQFGVMIWCKVRRNPADYVDYGCWCGLGGKGQPVDEIDQCCYEHDKCYDKLIEKKICSPSSRVYTATYLTKGCTDCVSVSSFFKCNEKLCECDAAAAKCFKNYEPRFRNKYKTYDQSKC